MTDQSAAADGPRRNRRDTNRRPISTAIHQMAKSQSRRPFPPMRLISDDEVESIHVASLKVLSEIGMDFMLPEAREILRKAGAKIDGERVRFDPAMIEAAMATAPSDITIHSRNPARSMHLGGASINFGTVGSPPNCSDMDNGRRTGNRVDFRKFLKMAHHFNAIDFVSGYPVEPIDIHASVRHLEVLRDVVGGTGLRVELQDSRGEPLFRLGLGHLLSDPPEVTIDAATGTSIGRPGAARGDATLSFVLPVISGARRLVVFGSIDANNQGPATAIAVFEPF